MIISRVPEEGWTEVLAGVPEFVPTSAPMLVVAPHPDDETLGAGGLIAAQRRRGVAVTVVAVTDGESAYGYDAAMGELRAEEQAAALARLGVGRGEVVRLRLPDSGLAGREEVVAEALGGLVTPGMQLVAPWRGDFHPDHEVCGRAAEMVARRTGAPLLSYFFWTWHRGTPELLRGLRLGSLALPEEDRAAKREALGCHRSQLERAEGEPILPGRLLRPAWRASEVFVVGA